jgi:hypothetical protein
MMEDSEAWVMSKVEVGFGEKSSPQARSSRYQHDWLTAPREFRSTRKVEYIAQYFPAITVLRIVRLALYGSFILFKWICL